MTTSLKLWNIYLIGSMMGGVWTLQTMGNDGKFERTGLIVKVVF